MILFGKGEQLGWNFSMFNDSKLLIALDLEKAPLKYIPEELENFRHLKYLSLRDTKVKALPNSIGRLCNLETLDLRGSLVYDLLVEIYKLLKLQYLLVYTFDYESEYTIYIVGGLKIGKGIGCLEALQKLYHIKAGQGPRLFRELGRLIQLQKLGITKLRARKGPALCNVLEKLNRLRSLSIYSANEKEPLKLESMSVPPPLLTSLELGGPLKKLPHWILKLTNLMKLNLYWSGLGGEEDPLQVLEVLPNLEDLWVIQGHQGEMLHFREGCFAKMKFLFFMNLVGLKKMVIEEGALPLLRELYLGPCPQLEELPTFHFLGNLTILGLFDFQKHFLLDLEPKGSRHYWKVKHVPEVLCWIEEKVYKLGDPGLVEDL